MQPDGLYRRDRLCSRGQCHDKSSARSGRAGLSSSFGGYYRLAKAHTRATKQSGFLYKFLHAEKFRRLSKLHKRGLVPFKGWFVLLRQRKFF